MLKTQGTKTEEDVKDIYFSNFGDNMSKCTYTNGYILTIYDIILVYTIWTSKMSLTNARKIYKAIIEIYWQNLMLYL